MRGLIKRTPECALHVHVAMPSPDAAVAGLDGPARGAAADRGAGRRARRSGSAWTPAWRAPAPAVVRAYPGPRACRRRCAAGRTTWRRSTAIGAGGGPKDHTMVWWDARLQPRLGTIELRELDVQTGLEEAAGIAALVHALARRAAEEPPREPAPAEALHWSSFRAVRDGPRRRAAVPRPPAPGARGGRGAARRAARRGRRARGSRAHPARRRGAGAPAGGPRRGRDAGAAAPSGRRTRAARSSRLARLRADARPAGAWLGYAASRSAATVSSLESRRRAWSSSWRTRSLERPEPAAGLAQGLRLLAVEAEAQRDHGALVLGQGADGLAQRRRSPSRC